MPRGAQAPSSKRSTALAQEFLEGSLALSPVSATQVGYHRHKGRVLDEEIDDMSAAGLRAQREFYAKWRERFSGGVKEAELSRDDRADLALLRDQIDLGLLEIDTIQNYRHNPTVYVELAGNALFLPLVLEYAPKPERLKHLAARLEKIPALLQQARAQLVDSDPIYTKVALEENEGNAGLAQGIGGGKDTPAGLKPRLEKAAAAAVQALHSFSDYLKDLPAKGNWRLGPENYRRKLRLALGTDLTPDQVLSEAESELGRLREEMYRVALPLYQGDSRTDQSAVIRAVLDQIAGEHTSPDKLKADVTAQLG